MTTAFQSSVWLIPATLLAMGVAVLAWRHRSLPRLTKISATLGALLLALAAGGPVVERADDPDDVAVLVDLSPSTRGAAYRDPAALRARLAQLLEHRPYRLIHFGEGTDRTVFAPPPAQTVVAFTDGRFALPAVAPPTFAVVDPALDRPADARVTSLDVRDGVLHVALANGGARRALDWSGVTSPPAGVLETGAYSLGAAVAPDAPTAGVRIAPADAWPENDSLAVVPPPPPSLERWWVGDAAPAGPWTHVAPAALPADLSALLRSAVVVLRNVPADALTAPQQSQLDAYVRDAGGTVVILGGDRAFAAGGYTGTTLDALSPLASDPPLPTVEWTILTDASGSMDAPVAGGGTRFDAAARAAGSVVKHLPPGATVAIGSFARDVRWWSTGKPAGATPTTPPADLRPTGETNLAAAVDALATGPAAGKTRQILLITDGEAEPLDVPAVAERLRGSASSLNVLSIGAGRATASLAQVAAATGGAVVAETDPAAWQRAADRLLRAAGPSRLEQTAVAVQFTDALASLGQRRVAPPWNRTWPRAGATVAGAAWDDALAAWWAVGAGRAVALAYDADPATVDQVVKRLVRPPRDPRFVVTWADDPTGLRVTVDAIADGQPINGASLVLNLGTPRPIPQTAPGRYELTVDAPRQPALATVAHYGQVIARRALAGHYAPEFVAIGNDYATLRALADRTGGRVVWPNETARLDLPDRSRATSLAPYLAALAALMLGLGLIAWRRGR